MSHLIVEIIEGHNQPFTVGQGEKMRWKQKAYMHNGGAFPVEFKLPLNSQQHGLLPGKYTVAAAAFRVGKYGDLEVNQWDLRDYLQPAQPQDLKKVG